MDTACRDREPRMFLGESHAARQVRERIELAAACDEPVLIVGETGTGKELVARGIHGLSRRGPQPLAVINCGAIQREMLAAELFGHVAGSFTGAQGNRQGRIRAATGSSLFLDEVGETSPSFQIALLRAIEYNEVQPVGSDRVQRAEDVRYLSATNHDLDTLSGGKESFRSDLFYRLAGLIIQIPPLRRRLEDIETLLDHFLKEICDQYGEVKRLSIEAAQILRCHDFPGNVRELRLILRRGFVASQGRTIRPSDLRQSLIVGELHVSRATTPGVSGRALHTVIQHHICASLESAGGNLSKCARSLEIPRSTLQHYLGKYAIDASEFRGTWLRD